MLEKINSNELKEELNKLLDIYDRRENFKKFYNSTKFISYGILTLIFIIICNVTYIGYGAIMLFFPYTIFSALFVENIVPNTLLTFLPKPQ